MPDILCLVMLCLAPGAAAQEAQSTPGASQPADCAHFLPYSPDSEHIWNRVHRRLFERAASDGKALGCDELDLLLWKPTVHVLAEPAYKKTVSLLDEFIQHHAERLVRDPIKRAIFQHDLWNFFDWLAVDTNTENYQDFRTTMQRYRSQREQLRRRVATIIRSVALTRSKIENLPNNFDQLKRGHISGELPELPDEAQGWVLVGREDGLPVASFHVSDVSPRSVFLVYLKLPGAGTTSPYLHELRAYTRARPDQEDCQRGSCYPPQFPAGTQMALVRRAMLIDTESEPVVSPLTEGIQLRRYEAVEEFPKGYRMVITDRQTSPQQLAEYRFRRSLYLAGMPSLHALQDGELVTSSSGRFTFPFVGDPLDRYGESALYEKPLRGCLGCHTGPGIVSVNTYSFQERRFLIPSTSNEQEATAISYLRSLSAWKLLLTLMGTRPFQSGPEIL